MIPLYLLEPTDPGAAWAPFACVRPIAELRAGIWRIRERWEAVLQAETAGILGNHVAGFLELDTPQCTPLGPISGPACIAVSWFAPSGMPLDPSPTVLLNEGSGRLVHDGATVAWLVPAGERWAVPTDEGGEYAIDGLALRGTFDLLNALDHLLPADCADFLAESGDPVPDGSVVLGDPADIVCLGANVEPGVVFDVRQGAVVLEEGVEVRSGSRLEGPLYVGTRSRLLGGSLRASILGPRCNAHGEISASVFLGYANKAHDGFVGNSVIGHWVNLGAGTTTSNLKNTYGEVRLDVAGERIETGRTFVGSLIGDHAKTAIGTMLPTGSVIGMGANLFVEGPCPKYTPPFSWGTSGKERMTEEGFLTVAERVMPRREVPFTEERKESLRATYRRLAG